MSGTIRDFIEGMSVSVDVSTGEHGVGRRYFGTVTEVMDAPEDKHGVALLVQDAEPNFEQSQIQSGGIPPDWKLVPVEMTQAMIDQMRFGWSDISTAHIVDRWKRAVAAAPQPPVVEMTTDEWIDRNVSGNPDLIKAMKIVARPESAEHDIPQPTAVDDWF